MTTNGGSIADYVTQEREITAHLDAQTKTAVAPTRLTDAIKLRLVRSAA